MFLGISFYILQSSFLMKLNECFKFCRFRFCNKVGSIFADVNLIAKWLPITKTCLTRQKNNSFSFSLSQENKFTVDPDNFFVHLSSVKKTHGETKISLLTSYALLLSKTRFEIDVKSYDKIMTKKLSIEQN